LAYEYNPESSRFEIANPHRVENWFLAAAALVCFGCAGAALLIGRRSLSVALTLDAARPIAITVLLLIFGMLFAISAMRQLRFFFGRNQPAGLVPEQPREGEGSTPDAEALRETLRQNAITYKVPTSAVDNLLYSLAKDLVFAPPRTQNLARAEFQNALGAGFLLLCFLVSMIGTGGAVRDWLSALYLVLMGVLILLPLHRGAASGRALTSRLIIVLVIAAVIAPVLLPYLIGHTASPFARYIQLPAVTATILVSMLAGSALLLSAALAQMVRPNRIAMAQSLQTVSMNAPPNQIFLEFDREMQRGWTEKIPNRIYLRTLPKTAGTGGSFEGQAIEETQPVPQDTEPLSLARCLGLATYRWLIAVDLFALVATGAGASMLLDFAARPQDWGALVMGLSLLVIARFAFTGGNLLWRRFEFVSRIYWLECHGNYQNAKTSIGALLQDRVKTEKDVINVEDMTLRLWVAEVDSVAFGPDLPRSLMSIRGLPQEADNLSRHLAAFAQQQASVVAPGSDKDLQRLAMMQKLNPGSPTPLPAAAQQALGVTPASVPADASSAPRFCMQCGTRLAPNAQFCWQCGARLAPA
jgi:hypothetical protein